MVMRETRIKKFNRIDLYPVITESFCAGRTSLDICRAVIAGGAKIIQLREKEKTVSEFLTLAQEVRAITLKADVLLIINDNVELALEANADGVHLGQADMSLSEARAMAPELLLGHSTHSVEEATVAEQAGADYINIGPVFSTQTKVLPFPALGVETVKQISQTVSLPFTVMGGINEKNIDQVLTSGASKIAMVTAITQAQDVMTKVKTLRERILTEK